jgi:nucleoid DNA-binding protein
MLPSIFRALIEENPVAISGFGTFFVKHISSQIKEDIVYPPHNIVEFDFSKEVEDFSFVSKLSQWEQIRIDEAQTIISEWVDLIEKGLEENKSLFFDDFGTFSKNISGKIVFQGVIIPQLNIEYEGFEPVIIPFKNDKKTDRDVSKPVKDKRVILHNRKRKRDKILFLSIALAAVMLLCVLFMKDKMNSIYQVVKKNTKTFAVSDSLEEENVIPIAEIAEVESVDLAVVDTAIEIVDIGQEILDKKTENSKNTLISLSDNRELYLPYIKGNYYIIAGSFVKEESALLHIKQKKLEKYNAKLVVHPESPRIRICIGVFDNEHEAIHIAAQLDKNYWVLK